MLVIAHCREQSVCEMKIRVSCGFCFLGDRLLLSHRNVLNFIHGWCQCSGLPRRDNDFLKEIAENDDDVSIFVAC